MLHFSTKTVKTLKISFNVIFIAFIAFRVLRRAFVLIPEHWLFFLTSDAVENFVAAVIAYGLYYYVFKLKELWKKAVFVGLGIGILLALAVLKCYRVEELILHDRTFNYFTSFLGQTLLFYLLIYFVNRLEFLNRYQQLENQLHQAQAQLLRNQLHPHFLFNAFNSLYSLSLKNHANTPEYILKLSSMMRYLTDDTPLHKVPLQKEIDFIQQYLSIEQIRFGEDARIEMTVNSTISDATVIAPYLLIPLVENAFKHGFYTNSKKAYVTLNLNIVNNTLIFTVENSVFEKQHFQEISREGKGLENLKQRLQLLYPKNHSLSISSTATAYKTQLKILLN